MGFSVKISRLEDYGQRQQAGLWNLVMWLDNGGEVLFAHSGVDFNDETYAGPGWLMEFNASFYHDFMGRYREDYNSGLLANRTSSPVYLSITDKQRKEMHDLAVLLKKALELNQPMLYLQPYADLILLNINHCYATLVNGWGYGISEK